MTGRGSFPPAERLYEHAGFLRALARSLLLDEGQADDVVQQTLLAALEKPPEDRTRPRAWLSGVAKNLARMKRRGEGRRAQREQSVARRESGGAPADEILARLETQRRVVDAVMALDDPYRTAVVYRYFDDLRPQEIAARLGEPVGTIKTRLKRALKMLRDRLDQDVEGGRAAWAPLLLPLALPRTAPVTVGAALLGGILTVKTLWLTAAALVIAVAVFVSVQAADRDVAPRAERHDAATEMDDANATSANTKSAPKKDAATDGLTRRTGAITDPDGNAVEGAQVIALRWTFGTGDEPTGTAARSGADGGFALPLDPDRNVKVRVEHPLYLRAEFTMRRGERPSFVLERGAPLQVTVLDPAGKPLADAAVTARKAGWVSRWGPWSAEPVVEHTIYGSGTTDARGEVAVAALPPGDAVVRVDHPNYARAELSLTVADLTRLRKEIRLTHGATIRGAVTGVDGAPLANAKVYTGFRPDRPAWTDEDGRYELRGIQPGNHEVRADGPGHGTASYGALDWGKAIHIPLREGETLDGIDIRLAPETRLRGRVVDADGKGVPGVFVLARSRVKPGGRATAKTGPDGRFDVGPLALRAPAPVHVQFAHATISIAPITRNAVAPASVVDLGDLRAAGRGRVSGTVSGDTPTEPFVRANRVGDRYASYTARIDAEGKFSLRLPAGRFRIAAEVRDRPDLLSGWKQIDVPEGGEVTDVELRIAPVFELSGVVRTDAGGISSLQKLIAQRIDGEPLVRDAWTNRDGRYFFQQLPAGRYKVGLSDATRMTNEAVFLAHPEPRVVSADHGTLDFVSRTRGTFAEGVVVSKRDGQPVRNFEVSLTRYRFFVPQGGPSLTFRTSDGRFRIAVPEAGTWAVSIRAAGFAPALTTRRAIGKESVDFDEIRLGDPGRVSGIVRDASGQPVRFARVHLLSAKLEVAPSDPLTGPRGGFAITDVVPGTYTVFVVTPQHPLGIQRGVTVTEGEETKVAVDLPVASPLTIHVRDEAGRPIAGAKLTYTFAALRPLHSGLVAMYEPASFGANTSDDQGRIVKPYVPAGELHLKVTAKGYTPIDKTVELEPGTPTEVTITLVR